MAKPKSTFLILDGNALLHRAWHALPPLTAADGTVVNAVYGFAMVVEKMLSELKPAYMAVAWDLPGKTFRHEKYEAYKATREKKEQELYDQIPMVQELLEAYGIPSFSAPGFEADDVIATLAEKTGKKDVANLVVTGDLDSLQLVNKQTKVLFFQKGISETKLYDEAAVRERFGFGPERMIDYKALRGDPSDNIPGVAGIGEKTATELIQSFGSVDGILKALKRGDIPDKAAKKLSGQEEVARSSLELVTLVRDVPLAFRLASASTKKPDADALLALFRKWQFSRLIKKYANEGEGLRTAPAKKTNKKAVRPAVLRDLQELREQTRAFHGKRIGIWLAKQPADLFGSTLGLLALSDGVTTLLVPHPEKGHVELVAHLLPYVEQTAVHGLKELLHLFADQGVEIAGALSWFDLELAGYLLDSGSRSHDLGTLCHAYLQKVFPAMPEAFPTEKDQQLAAAYVSLFPALAQRLEEALQKNGLLKLFKETEMPLAPVLFSMERVGVRLDTDTLKVLSKEFEKSIGKLTKQVYKEAGQEFNVNSPSQLAEILFEKLKLPTPGIKRTKSGFSTAASELEKLEDAHSVVPLIGQYRELAKLQSTYVDTLPTLVGKDGRVHTHFNQTVTSTGRLSSSDPNLQNIPIKTELGNEIRKTFVADRGYKLVAADYSQIELRLAAVITKDQAFIRAFQEGADIHRRTAAEVAGIAETEVTDEQRRAAKAINFGILYGMGPRSLARSTGLTLDEAKRHIDRYFEIHHAIRGYIDQTKIKAHEKEFVETMFGRRRWFPEINSGVQMLVAATERMAVNMPIQGTAADIMKMAMLQVDAWVRTVTAVPKKKDAVRLLLQVHDELVLEVEDDMVDVAAEAVKKIMETVVTLEVPLAVDVEVGDNWGAMKHWSGTHEAE